VNKKRAGYSRSVVHPQCNILIAKLHIYLHQNHENGARFRNHYIYVTFYSCLLLSELVDEVQGETLCPFSWRALSIMRLYLQYMNIKIC